MSLDPQPVAKTNSSTTGQSSIVKTRNRRRTYPWQCLGFQKGYNVPLFLLCTGSMLMFCLSKLTALDVGGVWSKQAGAEWYWYSSGHYRVGITIHLTSVVPAGILMMWQFIPAVRYKSILFHRINGYIILLLVALANISGLMIARRVFGGDLSTQCVVGMLAIITTVGTALAYYNIKVLQIEQHRAWMLRTWVYLGTVLTTSHHDPRREDHDRDQRLSSYYDLR